MKDTMLQSSAMRRITMVLVLATLAPACAGAAGAVEVIPSIGVTKSTDTNAGDARAFGGLALRIPLLPFLKVEGGISYRQDSYSGGDLKVRQWPVSASVWVSPLPVVYAGGGVGWYRTTFDYLSSLAIEDRTTQKMGVHLGGGVDVPLTPGLGLDLNGRYVFMQREDSSLEVPTTFNPDFWTLALGLAIRF